MKRSILFVDDERINLLNAQHVLGDRYDLTAVEFGEAALEELERRRFDIVLTDQKMPGITGVALINRMREGGDETPAVIVTGYVDDPVVTAAGESGLAAEIVFKPIRIQQLIDVIEEITA